jgi:hypothetical protein
MDWKEFIRVDWTLFVNWLTNNVDNSTKSLWSDWHNNGALGITNTLSSNESFSGIKSNGSDVVTTQMLGDLEHESVIAILYLKGIENWGKISLELHIHNGTNDL